MSAKRKKESGQPELPIEGTPAETKTKPAANGNGGDHVVAETVEMAVAHKPFDPKKMQPGLHTRVDRGFLDYASYVIRDRAIPNLADGLKPVQRRIDVYKRQQIWRECLHGDVREAGVFLVGVYEVEREQESQPQRAGEIAEDSQNQMQPAYAAKRCV